MGQWEEELVLLSAFRHSTALSQLRWRDSNSFRQAGVALGQGITWSLCLLPHCSCAGLLAELRGFGVFTGVQQHLQEAHGVLYHFALAYNSSPSTWSHKYRSIFLTQKVLGITGYLDQPCLNTSKRKEKLYLLPLEKSKFVCEVFLSVCLLHLHSFGFYLPSILFNEF